MEEAKLFKNGESQAVRLPKAFRMSGRSVYVRNLDGMVLLIPKKAPWDLLAKACEKFTDDFMTERDQGHQERDEMFE